MKKRRLISKSKYVQSYNCSKKLWFMFHSPKLAKELSLSEIMNMEEGNIIGELARNHPMFKNGILCDHKNKRIASQLTEKYLKNSDVLFEATFIVDNKIAQVDILQKNSKGNYNLIEVKSSSKVKKEHLIDVAYQKRILKESGRKVDKVFIMHLNSSYMHNGGDINLNEYFILEEVSSKIQKYYYEIPRKINKHISKLNRDTKPKKTVGRFCKSPHKCPFYDQCHKDISEDSVDNLSRLSQEKKKTLKAINIFEIKEVPETFPLSEKQEIQRSVSVTGESHLKKDSIKDFIEEIKYPIYHIDFEATNSSVPMYTGVKPNQFIVYQISIHKEFECGKIEHFEYLNTENNDPRINVVEFMKDNIEKDGTILVWNKAFEKTRLVEFIRDFPKYKELIELWIDRLVDLAVPFQKMWYYNKAFRGSYSIKNVLPVMAPGINYDELDTIKNGSDSQAFYSNLILGMYDRNPIMKKEIEKSLLEYCKLDTYAMILILKKLNEIVNNK